MCILVYISGCVLSITCCRVADIAFSLDGGIFATCSVDRSIKVCVLVYIRRCVLNIYHSYVRNTYIHTHKHIRKHTYTCTYVYTHTNTHPHT